MAINLRFFLILLLGVSLQAQHITEALPDFDRTGMETSILYNGASISNILNYKDRIHNTYSFYQVYKAIAFSDFDKRLQPIETFKIKQKKVHSTNIIPLSLIYTEFETLNKKASDQLVKRNGTIQRLNTSVDVFDKNELLVITPLKNKHKGLLTTFQLSKDFVFNTTSRELKRIEANFDNGEGFVNIPINTAIEIRYHIPGKKVIAFKIAFKDGTTKTSKAALEVTYSNEDHNTLFRRAITTFTSSNTALPNLTPYGEPNYKGIGEYDIYLGADNILDKPIFLIDGFDPSDTRDIPALYNMLNYFDGVSTQNLGDTMRAQDYDIVVLNFPVYIRPEDSAEIDGGSDFIERNAMLLVELIGIINGQKSGNEQNVIIGPSMGGLISRYALNFMENQGLTHDTRLWLSFDAPHLGANVPIGFQHMFNYLSYGLGTWIGDFSVEALQPVVDGMLKSAAARQMLTDQFEMHLQSGQIAEFDVTKTLPIPHTFFDLFYTNLNALTPTGFPEQTRNISMINGSGSGNPFYDESSAAVLPGRKVLDAFIPNVALLTDAYLDAWYTPTKNTQSKVSDIFIDAPLLCFCDITADAYSKGTPDSDGVDAAPGGLFDISELAADFAGTDPLIDEFLNALETNYFNFIPTVSAMALQNDGAIDWFHTISGLTSTGSRTVDNVTPFDNWYMPDDNQNHITLTNDNVQFALDEIIQETLSNDDLEKQELRLEKNPINDHLILLTNHEQMNATLNILDITGKRVYTQELVLKSRTEISAPLASGLYILHIVTDKQLSKLFKLVVN